MKLLRTMLMMKRRRKINDIPWSLGLSSKWSLPWLALTWWRSPGWFMTLLRTILMMKSRRKINDRSTLVTGGFFEVESTLVNTGRVEITWMVFDTFEDDFDDEKEEENQ